MKKEMQFVLLMCITLSCGEIEIDKSLKAEDSSLLVVEAVLTNEKISHRIKLTHPYRSLNGTPLPATGAIVSVAEDKSRLFSSVEKPAGSGEYFTTEMTAVLGKRYTLYIQYRGREYFALAESVPVQPLQPLQYDKTGDGNFQLRLSESGSDPNYIDYRISWQNTPVCLSGDPCQARVVFYDLKTIDVNSLFKPDKAGFSFPLNSTVIRRKYSVSPEYQKFLRSVLSETEWRGGLFDVQREDVPTNLGDGAIGFFAVSTVLSDTTIIVQKP